MIHLGAAEGDCVVTVLKVGAETADLRVIRAAVARPGVLESETHTMKRDAVVRVNASCSVTVVDLREEKVRLGIDAPKECSVHRVEVYEAIRREDRDRDSDPDIDLAGSRVPRPTSPKPPSLDVRLKEPRPGEEGGGENQLKPDGGE
jgi:carbon storage regulator